MCSMFGDDNLFTIYVIILPRYVVLPAKKANEGNYEFLDKKGTGGTSKCSVVSLCLHTCLHMHVCVFS